MLREMFTKIELRPSARGIVVSLLEHGDVDDVTAILEKIGSLKEEIHYQNHMELCVAVKQS